eukprot:2479340-Amphidinium_carterae.2
MKLFLPCCRAVVVFCHAWAPCHDGHAKSGVNKENAQMSWRLPFLHVSTTLVLPIVLASAQWYSLKPMRLSVERACEAPTEEYQQWGSADIPKAEQVIPVPAAILGDHCCVRGVIEFEHHHSCARDVTSLGSLLRTTQTSQRRWQTNNPSRRASSATTHGVEQVLPLHLASKLRSRDQSEASS